MYPNDTLKRIRLLVEIITTEDEPNEDANDLAELIRDLDTHLMAGGALPNDWWTARKIAQIETPEGRSLAAGMPGRPRRHRKVGWFW